MYNFIDTTQTQEGMSLPSEAMKINGKYIENQIPGYRTLTVEGREAISPELSTYETGIRDGSTLQGKRFPARTIRIIYQLIAESNEAFREAFNILAQMLNVEDAELIFNDEQDKFFIGTPSYIGEVEPGKNSVVGEFEILCLDPFKYSVQSYEYSGSRIIDIPYNGTYKCFPTLQANFFNENEVSDDGETMTELTGKGDCGYVAFTMGAGKIIQIGDPDEGDTETISRDSETLVSQRFDSANAWSAATNILWRTDKTTPLDWLGARYNANGEVIQEGIGTWTRMADFKTATDRDPIIYDDPNPTEAKPLGISVKKASATKGNPDMNYEIHVFITARTATTAKLKFEIRTKLGKESNFFGKAYTLQAKVTLLNKDKSEISSYTATLKDKDSRWGGTTTHNNTDTEFSLDSLTTEAATFKYKFEPIRPRAIDGNAGLLDDPLEVDFTVPAYITPPPPDEVDTYYLTPTFEEINETEWHENNWHGESITRTIPQDSTGDLEANNGTLSFAIKYHTPEDYGNNFNGYFIACLTSNGSDRKVIAAAAAHINGGTGYIEFYVNGKLRFNKEAPMDYLSGRFAFDSRYSNASENYIKKMGDTVAFSFGGGSYRGSFKDEAIADCTVDEVSFIFLKKSKIYLRHCGLYWAKFVKHYTDIEQDKRNKFTANDVVEADCNTGEILLNGTPAPQYGALGNDWETFCLEPGLNHVGCLYSDWVDKDYAPRFKVKYREVFL